MSRIRQMRQRNKNILIVCEGRETEINYFDRYREIIRKKATLRIPKSTYTDPVNLVNYAKRYLDYEDIPVDAVWCVFDADNNNDMQIIEANRLAQEYGFQIILSNPSFELWFLLHYKYTTRLMLNAEVLQELGNYIKNYSKNKDYFDLIYPLQADAIARAKRLNKKYEEERMNLLAKACNPSTQVYQMVEYLNSIA